MATSDPLGGYSVPAGICTLLEPSAAYCDTPTMRMHTDVLAQQAVSVGPKGRDTEGASGPQYGDSTSPGMETAYRCKEDLVDHFLGVISTNRPPWPPLAWKRGFSCGYGRAGIVAVSSPFNVLAFVAKLTSLKEDLPPAHRTERFTHQANALLPSKAGGIAQRCSVMFERRRMWLCSITRGNLVVLRDASESDRIQARLTREAGGRVWDEHRDCVLGSVFYGPPPRSEVAGEWQNLVKEGMFAPLLVHTEDMDWRRGRFEGMSVPVANLFEYLAAGQTLGDFLKAYGHVTPKQAVAALRVASRDLVGERG